MFLFLAKASCLIEREYTLRKRLEYNPPNVTEYNYTEQLKDHFAEPGTPDNTFSQRYSVQQTAYEWKPGQPIFLYISGEADTFDHGLREHLVSLATELKAVIVALEHRYFGLSYPTPGDVSTENLQKYMNVEQALEDYAQFRQFYQGKVDPDNISPWLIVGGSYSGMLSAFSRKLHGDLFKASISSSGVVQAYDDFPQYDMGAAIAMGPQCAAIARETRVRIEDEIDNGRLDELEQAFDMVGLSDKEFLQAVGDMYVMNIQYGETWRICDPLLNAVATGADPINALAKLARTVFKEEDCDGNCTEAYNPKSLQGTTGYGHGGRVWTWMTCNQLGWWQTGPQVRTAIRSPRVDKALSQAQCHTIFDTETIKIPDLDVSVFNTKYGGYNQDMTHVFYGTGDQDPWTWACITENNLKAKGSYAHTVVGPNLAHCADQKDYNDAPPPDLARTRQWQKKLIAMWLKEDETEAPQNNEL